jgi:hypothetical protein
MKSSKSIIWTLVALIITGALYRIVPNRPLGFAPQIAMAIFGGSMVKEKKWAFALPLFSMFLSDLLYQALFSAGFSSIPGFYGGQWENYLLIGGITLFSFTLKKISTLRVAAYSFGGATLYFLASNFLVWAGGGGYGHPHNFSGLMATYVDGIPFYTGSLAATLIFSTLLFGGYYLLNSKSFQTGKA